MPFFLTEKLGPRQSLTPEGFLVCHDVAIARTGSMLYAAGEVPVTAKDGIVTIERTDDHVFADRTLASFEGKAVTLDHPAQDVDPTNWSQLAKGFAQNVRRGTGLDNDLLIADLVITEARAIKEVRDGLREVSCGYDANYEEIEPGRGRQTDIIGNHIALVERGRCGTRCAIGDSQPMKWIDRLRAAFKAQDEAAFEKVVATRDGENPFAKEGDDEKDEEKGDKTADALTAIAATLSTIDSRLTALETRDSKAKDEDEEEKKDDEAKTEDSDEEESEEEKEAKGKTGDSAAFRDEASDVFARAEILSPGLHMPTFDAAATPQKTKDALCNLRRKALETAFNAGTYRDAITPFLGKTPDFKSLTCDAMTSAFVGASEIVRRTNNAQTLKSTFDGAKDAAKVASSISTINAKNAAFWARS